MQSLQHRYLHVLHLLQFYQMPDHRQQLFAPCMHACTDRHHFSSLSPHPPLIPPRHTRTHTYTHMRLPEQLSGQHVESQLFPPHPDADHHQQQQLSELCSCVHTTTTPPSNTPPFFPFPHKHTRTHKRAYLSNFVASVLSPSCALSTAP